MDALCRVKAKSKVNSKSLAHRGRVRVAATQAVQAQGQEGGGLRAPLWRRHARGVVEVGGRHGCRAGLSNQQAVSQSNPVAVSQRDVVTSQSNNPARGGVVVLSVEFVGVGDALGI